MKKLAKLCPPPKKKAAPTRLKAPPPAQLVPRKQLRRVDNKSAQALKESGEPLREELCRQSHPDAGKWRCACCDQKWVPAEKLVRGTLPCCPGCGEKEDVFPADDGGWELAAEERASRNSASKLIDDDF